MLAEADNFTPPAAITAWLACAAFTLWFLLLVDKVIQRLRGKAPQPPNRQLEAGQLEINRRVIVLEEWKDGLLQKLDADKTELLAAGERREEKLSAEISGVATRVDRLQAALANIPGELMALLANAKKCSSPWPQFTGGLKSNQPQAMQLNGCAFKTERGCSRNVNRSVFILLRLVCDTAALRNSFIH